MGGLLRIGAAVLGGLALLAAITAAALIGLSAECTGSSLDCPPHAHRTLLLAAPVVSAVLLLVGAGWAVVRRRLWPLVLAEAVVLAAWAFAGVALGGAGLATAILLGVAALLGRGALRCSSTT